MNEECEYDEDEDTGSCIDCGREGDDSDEYINFCDGCNNFICNNCSKILDGDYLCKHCYKNRIPQSIQFILEE